MNGKKQCYALVSSVCVLAQNPGVELTDALLCEFSCLS